MTIPELETPNSPDRIPFFVANGMLAACGAVVGGMTGGTFAGEQADPELVAQQQDLLDQANELSAAADTKQQALDLLDDVKPRDDWMLVQLRQEITADQTQAETLTTTANSLPIESDMDPVGLGIGAAIGAVVFVAGMHLKTPIKRFLDGIALNGIPRP